MNDKDTIYRQAAIDAINCDITITGRQNAELVAATIGMFADRIKALPSAQPEQQWIIEALKEHLGESFEPITKNEKEFKNWLERMRWHVLECDKLARELERAKAFAQPERKNGKWEICNILDYAQRPTGRKILRCPFCGYLTDEFRSMVDYYHKRTRFCPNCGNEM